MTIARVAGQTDQIGVTTSGTSIGITFPQNVVAGNVIVLFGRGDNVSAGTYPDDMTVADNLGNTYVKDETHFTASEFRVTVFHSNIATGGACTATLTSAGDGAARRVIGGLEYTLAGGATLDKTAKTSGGPSTAPSSGATATTTAASELLFGAISDNFDGSPYTAGAGWTKRLDSGSAAGRGMMEDQIVSATGAYTANATSTGSVLWTAIIATYKEAAVAAPVVGNYKPVENWS